MNSLQTNMQILRYVSISIIFALIAKSLFQLVEPDNNFQAGGVVRLIQYRNKDTNEIVVEN
jgi:branched-subunit amino acid transport protein